MTAEESRTTSTQTTVSKQNGERKSAATAATTTDSTPTTNRVTFSDVLRIHVHWQTVSSNPSVTRGPPIELDWTVQESYHVSLEQHERDAAQRYADTRSTFDKEHIYPRPVRLLSALRRWEILLDNEISGELIQEYVAQVENAKRERNETIQNIGTRRERKEEFDEERRLQQNRQSKGCFSCFGNNAVSTLSPADQYLECKFHVDDKTIDKHLSSCSPFLENKGICKNCSQRAWQVDKACVKMFECNGHCSMGCKQCPMHTFIENHSSTFDVVESQELHDKTVSTHDPDSTTQSEVCVAESSNK